MVDLLIYLLFLPALFVWSAVRLLDRLAEFFGLLFGPALLALYFGALLAMVRPAAPGAVFESLFQVLAGIEVFGVRLPLILLIAGVGILAIGAFVRATQMNAKRRAIDHAAHADALAIARDAIARAQQK